ncbi:hypothetical protein BBK36DRAFT_1169211 [Trichoderma citrinoviride]|uniref:NAD(P)-binding protein n=1 Tax=Trichoderma citrinoviride TaxID=58853 RepID=A0A2T4B843_9HYPO|nr:hypothetical protein BBK36DRAFT_1169211 [Trichoderma citrinoviride]PTB65497.1 hypothetical protein BBK36DRAFT_1169211 [Trichoderma citrinoviride]
MFHLDPEYANPTGTTVVASGANGNIANHIVDQLVKTGYSWLVGYSSQLYGPGKIELAEVRNMAESCAFDEAVKGASGFIHMATPVMETADPNIAIPVVVNGTLNAHFVLTSSSGACTDAKPGKVFTIDSNTWKEEAEAAAWAHPPRKRSVEVGSRKQAKFHLQHVLPNANFGSVLDKHHQNGFDGEETLGNLPPQYLINSMDDAIVCVATLLYKDVSKERIFTFAYSYNWNDILAIFRELCPGRQLIDDIPNLQRDLSVVTNGRAEDLLKPFVGHEWTSLEETVKSSVADSQV